MYCVLMYYTVERITYVGRSMSSAGRGMQESWRLHGGVGNFRNWRRRDWET